MTAAADRTGEGGTYTHGHHDSVLRSHRWRTVENSAAYLAPWLRAGLDVLDVGCGPGTVTVDVARRVAPGRVVGLDASEDVLAEARAAAAGAGVDVRFETGDVHRLDHADRSFDVVHAHQVLQHLADPVAALREMRRVTRPGGLVAARDADYSAMTWFPPSEGLTAWSQLQDRVHRAHGGEPDAGRRLRSWALAAGFDHVASSASVWCFATVEDREWWSSLWAERVTSSGLATGALALGAATRDDLEGIARAWRAWGAQPHGWFAVVHGEILCRARPA
ncbi:MAG: methyltransferase domain-containing protein [Kineosporiaceae bacterium]